MHATDSRLETNDTSTRHRSARRRQRSVRLPERAIGALHRRSTLDAALAWAALGIPVVLVWAPTVDGRCTCRKRGCTSPGKHPIGRRLPRGVKDATTDARVIRRWWAAYPDANLGLAMGHGIFALDVDPRSGGDASFTKLVADLGLPPTLTETTSGGGLHIFYLVPPDQQVASSVLAPGIEVKGLGSMVVVAPSRHFSGTAYAVVDPTVPIIPATPTLLDLLAQRAAERACTPTSGDTHTRPDPRAPRGLARPIPFTQVAGILADLRAGLYGAAATRLVNGDLSGYPTPSHADMALARLTSFASRVPDVIDAVMRATALFRAKWRRPDYLPRTIGKVLATTAFRSPTPQTVLNVATRPLRPVGKARRGTPVRQAVKEVLLRYVSQVPGVERGSDGSVRIPIMLLAKALEVSRHTVWRALTELIADGSLDASLRRRRLRARFVASRTAKLGEALRQASRASELRDDAPVSAPTIGLMAAEDHAEGQPPGPLAAMRDVPFDDRAVTADRLETDSQQEQPTDTSFRRLRRHRPSRIANTSVPLDFGDPESATPTVDLGAAPFADRSAPLGLGVHLGPLEGTR